MAEAEVPCVPGYAGADQDEGVLAAEGGEIGFPLMVKAAAGGGGRGMRLVSDAADLPAAISGARSEAENAFGSGELILEKAVIEPRHVGNSGLCRQSRQLRAFGRAGLFDPAAPSKSGGRGPIAGGQCQASGGHGRGGGGRGPGHRLRGRGYRGVSAGRGW